MDRLARTMRLCACMYAVVGVVCFATLFAVNGPWSEILEAQLALILGGLLLLGTALGVTRRAVWTRWLAPPAHALLAFPLVLYLSGLTPPALREYETTWAWSSFALVAILYLLLIRFWKSRNVQAWFSLGPHPSPPSLGSNP